MEKMNNVDDLDDIFEELKDLSTLQRHTLKQRFRFIMREYNYRCMLYSILFNTFRIIMTVGSLTVPALLSIQQSSGNNEVYWLTWSMSLAVTTANGIMTLFRLDKQFFNLHATAERIRSETWQYIQLSGRYSGHYGQHHGHHVMPTHMNQFVYYCSHLEKINLNRVNDEYVKTNDENHSAPKLVNQHHVQKPNTDMLVPSPPDMDSPASVRKESANMVDTKDANDTKTTVVLQVHGSEQSPVSQTSVTGISILQDASEM